MCFHVVVTRSSLFSRLKEGRITYIPGYDRFRSDRRIQQVKAILDKVRYTNDILLPHELLHGASAIHKQSSILVPHTLQSRALKDHVAFVPNCTLVTQQTQALKGPRVHT